MPENTDHECCVTTGGEVCGGPLDAEGRCKKPEHRLGDYGRPEWPPKMETKEKFVLGRGGQISGV